MGRRRVKKPRHVVVDIDRLGNERIYYRKPGQRKIRLRGPLYSAEFWDDMAAVSRGELKPRAEKQPSRNALPPAGTFNRLCVDYYNSADFRRLNPDTRYRRRLTLDPLREEFADLPAARLEAKHIRKMRDKRSLAPHSANAMIKALRQLYKFGVEYGYVRFNPAREVSIIRGSSSGYHTWTPDEVSQYQEHWPTGTQQRLAFDLMLYTGVRRSDACRLGRPHMKNGRLIFTPEKGKERKAKMLSIPIHPNLAASIAATTTGELTFLVTAQGRPWGAMAAADAERVKHRAASFGNRFKDWCIAAGLPNCSAHGLRKVATIRLIEAGCTPHEAAAITGHDSMRVLETYARERDRAKLADAAMTKLIGEMEEEEAEESAANVPLDEPMGNHGTIQPSNPLKGKRSWKSLAPLRECVSNPMSGARG